MRYHLKERAWSLIDVRILRYRLTHTLPEAAFSGIIEAQ